MPICPKFQHYNDAGACVFDNVYDTPEFVERQRQAVADSLNAAPGSFGWDFYRKYGALATNQQKVVMECQTAIFNAQFFGIPVPVGLPIKDGQIDIGKLIADNPDPGNPANQPMVTFDAATQKFEPIAAPQPAVPLPDPVVTPGHGDMVGPLMYGNQYDIGPGTIVSPVPNVQQNQKVTQGGLFYTAHVARSLMGYEVWYTLP